ncbi:hypothetical protein [Pantoea]|uniref:Secreted protein n=2 Tax=Pantoea stewartii TaxID=66269 RepID=H3RA95_PANSE|nr:hypothetical protein [Pantoea]KKW51030.1 hypothetical protein XB02_08395 [Pantoea ananatis]ARF51542.1 hypothetical protein DSJ_21010 [Pantoea stewartii subsp. stewartii DC283]EHU02108.1 hypothetical protein CKS_0623 [Pantoea stewartii subsp. stewartii DC283]KAB0552876.1 hypothetical protein F7Q90_14370 [Pantoea stewartii subsp. stewartii]KGD83399.1 hypothetical protein HA47_10675 [Pantoea stewartii subsp. indologenes]
MTKITQIAAFFLTVALCAAPGLATAQLTDPGNVRTGLHPGSQAGHSEILGDSSLPQNSGQNQAQ